MSPKNKPTQEIRPRAITDIKVTKYQKQYSKMVWTIVFMNVPLEITDANHWLINDWEFYRSRWEDIAMIVREKTWKILDWNKVAFIICDDRLNHAVACENIWEWARIKKPTIKTIKYLREKISWWAKENSRHLIDHIIKTLPSNLQAIIVLVCTSKLATMSVALWYKQDWITNSQELVDAIKFRWEDKWAISYFPLKTTYFNK